MLNYLHGLCNGPTRFPGLSGIQFNHVYVRHHDGHSQRTTRGSLRRFLSVPLFHLTYPECSSGFHSPRFLMPTLPVVGCQQANGVGRYEIEFRVRVGSRTPVCISRGRCVNVLAY